MDMRDVLLKELGFVPGALAVMGKWEPNMEPAQCMREVSARAAAALSVAAALAPDGPGPFLLSAEGHLRRQPRPGCLLAAGILKGLGARPDRIRVWPSANRTATEVVCFHRMTRALDADGVLLLTGAYHEPRVRKVVARELPGEKRVVVRSICSALVRQALDLLPSDRREALGAVIEAGTRRGMQKLPVALSEGLAGLIGRSQTLEAFIADSFRGKVWQREEEMFPRLPDDLAPWP